MPSPAWYMISMLNSVKQWWYLPSEQDVHLNPAFMYMCLKLLSLTTLTGTCSVSHGAGLHEELTFSSNAAF